MAAARRDRSAPRTDGGRLLLQLRRQHDHRQRLRQHGGIRRSQPERAGRRSRRDRHRDQVLDRVLGHQRSDGRVRPAVLDDGHPGVLRLRQHREGRHLRPQAGGRRHDRRRVLQGPGDVARRSSPTTTLWRVRLQRPRDGIQSLADESIPSTSGTPTRRRWRATRPSSATAVRSACGRLLGPHRALPDEALGPAQAGLDRVRHRPELEGLRPERGQERRAVHGPDRRRRRVGLHERQPRLRHPQRRGPRGLGDEGSRRRHHGGLHRQQRHQGD